jgi:hypothetical protein
MIFRSRFHAQTPNQLIEIGVLQIEHVANNVLHIVQYLENSRDWILLTSSYIWQEKGSSKFISWLTTLRTHGLERLAIIPNPSHTKKLMKLQINYTPTLEEFEIIWRAPNKSSFIGNNHKPQSSVSRHSKIACQKFHN